MPGTAHAHKKSTPVLISADPDFTPSFYRPYETAAQASLLMLEDARRRLHAQCGENPVLSITYRLKSPASIREKLLKKGLPASASAAGASLRDIAGLRVVLLSEDAVYQFADLLCQSPAAEHFATHDYIAFPKPSGYRSLHLLMRVPIFQHMQTYALPVEIQLRTPSMDVWANIEHAIIYKPSIRA